MNWKIPLFKIYSDEDDLTRVSAVLRRNSNWAVGLEISEFETLLTKSVGVKHALVMNSGTSALLAVLVAHGVEGGEVITPSFTFTSTVNTIVLAGAKPVFAEIEAETYGLEYRDVLQRITAKTKAIIVVHYAGCPARDTLLLKKLCQEKNIALIEDAAEAQGASLYGQKVGGIGDSAIFSFCQNKIITTGEGGAVLTDSDNIFKEVGYVRSHGRKEENVNYFESTKSADYVSLGHNFRMPTMNAALGAAQIEKIDKLISLRRNNAVFLSEGLKMVPEVRLPLEPEGFNHVYQLFTIRLPSKQIRDGLQEYLAERGIMSKIYFSPIHLATYYRDTFGIKKGFLPKTEEVADTVLSLPFHALLTKEEIDEIITAIKDYFQGNTTLSLSL